MTPPTLSALARNNSETATRKIVGRYLRVAIDASNDLMASDPDRRIQCVGRLASGAGYGPHPWVGGAQAVGDGVRAVLRRPQREDDLKQTRVVLAQDHADGLVEVTLLVEHRDDHAH